MYQIQGLIKRRLDLAYSEETARAEHARVLNLLNRLEPYHVGFQNVEFVAEDVAYRLSEIGDALLTMDEPSSELLAELEELNGRTKVPLRGQEERHFAQVWSRNQAINEKHGSQLVTVKIAAEGARPAVLNVSVDYQSARLGSLRIDLPMQDQSDFWFQDWATMRDMMCTVLDIWNVEWIVAQPSMYLGMQRQLFPDRWSFGWMGWTPETLTETGEALAWLEPFRDGTYMLLQERMMTLKAQDVEACNKAEAHLVDYGILKTIS